MHPQSMVVIETVLCDVTRTSPPLVSLRNSNLILSLTLVLSLNVFTYKVYHGN